MTYSAGNPIAALDYNTFVSSLNTVLTAYGQTNLSTVTAGTSVVTSSGQWAALGANINLLGTHQGTTVSSYTGQFTAGTTVTALSTVSTDLANLNTNVNNAAASGTQFTAWTGTSSKTTATGSGSSAWTITFTHTVTFANATAATNFFNAGGLIKIQFGKASTGTVADTEWNAFVGANGAGGVVAGAIWLSSTAASKTINGSTYTGTTKTGGTGSPATLATGTGYAQLTSSAVTIYKQLDSTATYTGNYVQVNASQNGSGVLTLTTTWFDDGGAGTGSTDQITGGTASSGITFGTAPSTIVTYIPPANNLTNNAAWGTPTITASVA